MLKKIYNRVLRTMLSPNNLAKRLGVQFGKNCKFGTKKFGSEPFMIKIGNDFYSSGEVQFITHDGSVNILRNIHEDHKSIDLFSPIVIGNNVFIGYRSIILPGTRIGDNVIVGAGSVVKGKLESNSVYAGVPVKYICSIEEYLEKNKKNFIDTKHLQPKDKKNYVQKWLRDNYDEFN